MESLQKTLKKLTGRLHPKKERSRDADVVDPRGLASIPYRFHTSCIRRISEYDVAEFGPGVWDGQLTSSSSSTSPSSSQEFFMVARNVFPTKEYVHTTSRHSSPSTMTPAAVFSGLSAFHPAPYQFGKTTAGKFRRAKSNQWYYKASQSVADRASSSSPQSSLLVPKNSIAHHSSLNVSSSSFDSSKPQLLLPFNPEEIESDFPCDFSGSIKDASISSAKPRMSIPIINVWSPGPDPFLIWSSDRNAKPVDLSFLLPPPGATKEEQHQAYLEFRTYVPTTTRFAVGYLPPVEKRRSRQRENTDIAPSSSTADYPASSQVNPKMSTGNGRSSAPSYRCAPSPVALLSSPTAQSICRKRRPLPPIPSTSQQVLEGSKSTA
ncbi:hypothetical protein M422DRAFT_67790 [Sphaerobolus stellatus SS14]|uniref:Uncharacterized protein n=1 Tax=Sphaerobolus stellatus (strain SS14) TaxID=990650 RepID=A0A0C9VP44_SPHS4|nr:hypothetical protein M422DRAFT_67790 [Sphaerobolus stellatus SS14]